MGQADRLARERILEGAYACVARRGLAKTTVEDAARQAGVSRATVYRHFPGGREELIDAVVLWQFLRFFTRLYEELHHARSLHQVLERGLTFARRSLRQHEVLQRVLVTEPGVLLPKLTTEMERVVAMVAGFLTPYLARYALRDGVDVHEASDYLARMTLSLICAPGSWDLEDPEQTAELVRSQLLAGIVRAGAVDGSRPRSTRGTAVAR